MRPDSQHCHKPFSPLAMTSATAPATIREIIVILTQIQQPHARVADRGRRSPYINHILSLLDATAMLDATGSMLDMFSERITEERENSEEVERNAIRKILAEYREKAPVEILATLEKEQVAITPASRAVFDAYRIAYAKTYNTVAELFPEEFDAIPTDAKATDAYLELRDTITWLGKHCPELTNGLRSAEDAARLRTIWKADPVSGHLLCDSDYTTEGAPVSPTKLNRAKAVRVLALGYDPLA